MDTGVQRALESHPHPDERETNDRHRENDTELMRQVLALYNDLYKYCTVLLRGSHNVEADAEDLAQETILKVIGKQALFQQGKDVKPWLFKIAKNSLIDNIRHTKRPGLEQLQQLDASGEGNGIADEQLEKQALNPEAGLIMETNAREIEKLIYDFLSSQTSKIREIWGMIYYNNRSIRETAKQLKLQENDVRVTLYRTRQRLFKFLKEKGILERSPH